MHLNCEFNLEVIERSNSAMSQVKTSVPPELLEIVFEELYSESLRQLRQPQDNNDQRMMHNRPEVYQPIKADLSACSLVCRQWSVLARPLLFRDITYSFIRPPEHHDHLTSCLDLTDRHIIPDTMRAAGRWISLSNGASLPWKTLAMFICFLHSYPTIASLVTRCCLQGYCSPMIQHQARSQYYYLEEDTIDEAMFKSLILALPCLYRLDLLNVSLALVAHPNLTPLRSLAHLSVGFSGVGSHELQYYRNVFTPLCYFSEVEKFSYQEFIARGPHVMWPIAGEAAPHLARTRLLAISGYTLSQSAWGLEGLLHALTSFPNWAQRINELVLDHIITIHTPGLQRLLNALGSNLRQLRIRFSGSDGRFGKANY